MKSKHLFFTILKARKSKIKVSADLVSGEHLLPGIFLLCPHLVEGTRELSGVSFIRASIPYMKSLPS